MKPLNCLWLCILLVLCGCASPDNSSLGSSSSAGETSDSQIENPITAERTARGLLWNLTLDDLTKAFALTDNNWHRQTVKTTDAGMQIDIYEYNEDWNSYLSPSLTASVEKSSGQVASVSVSLSLEGETEQTDKQFRRYFSQLCHLFFPSLDESAIDSLRQTLRQSAENQTNWDHASASAVCCAQEADGSVQICFSPYWEEDS